MSLEDAYKLDDLREALRSGDVEAASKVGKDTLQAFEIRILRPYEGTVFLRARINDTVRQR